MTVKHNILVAIVTAGALLAAGCAAMVVGGSAAGGYAAGNDDRAAGSNTDDGAITTAILRRLTSSQYVRASAVSVNTRDGVVTLSGTVKSHVAHDQAERLAMDTNGVKSVINKLEVVPAAGK